MQITVQDIEELANQIVSEHNTQREKLLRMIRAFAKIINAREPGKFTRRACYFGDRAGECDGSYPPKQGYSDRSGPASISIISHSSEDVPTSGGFYYDYRTVPTDPGLFVTPSGTFAGGDMEGTGSFGQFPAHPGDCNVDCTITWRELDEEDVPLDRLQKAEKELRDLAFPLIAARDKDRAGITA